MGHQIRKWVGVRTDRSAGALERGVNGLEFRMASILVKRVS